MFKGLICPNITIFDDLGYVDLEAMKIHMDFLLDNGVKGLFVTGTYGAGYLMDLDERVSIYKLAKEVSLCHEGTFVIGHVGANDTRSSEKLTNAARELGLDAVSAVNPYTYKYTDYELTSYYKALVKYANDMPVLAYNNPGLTSKAIDINLLRMFTEVGVAGIKDSTASPDYAKEVTEAFKGTNFKYITGSNTNWPEMKKLGVDTMISGSANYIPELISKLYLSDGDEMLRTYDIINRINKVVKTKNSIISSHLAIKARGLNAGFTRFPLMLNYEEMKDTILAIKTAYEEEIYNVR